MKYIFSGNACLRCFVVYKLLVTIIVNFYYQVAIILLNNIITILIKPMILCIQLKQWPHKYKHWKVLYGTNFDEEIWIFSHATIQIFFQQLFVYVYWWLMISLPNLYESFLSPEFLPVKQSGKSQAICAIDYVYSLQMPSFM